MVVFIVLRVDGLLQSKHTIVNITICIVFFPILVYTVYFSFYTEKKLVYKKVTRCCVCVVHKEWYHVVKTQLFKFISYVMEVANN